ncbi:hypothetical protein [Streptomyces sp. NWU49]|nr:hypothetical protein [Streptomyces sp. NWU49]
MYSARRAHAWWASIAAVLLTAAGLVTWVLPGPGLPVLALGLLCSAVAGVLWFRARSR